MRILHVTQRYLPAVGGSELHLAELSSRFAADGHAVTIVTTDAFDFELFWNPHARRIVEEQSVIDGVRVLRFPVRHLPLSQLAYPAVRRLLWLLSRAAWVPLPLLQLIARVTPWTPDLYNWLNQTDEQFDLVAAMTIVFEPLVAAAQHYARRVQRPFVVYPLTHLGAGQTPGADALSRFYTMRHQTALVVNSDFLIANSADEAAYYHSFGMPADRTLAVGPGVELGELAGGMGERFRAQHKLDGPIVGALSAMAYDKGTVHVVEAVRALWRRGKRVHLVLAGALLEPFQRFLDALPAQERQQILVLGSIDHQSKLDLLDAIDLLALPSRTDSFGIVYLEAWAYRKPVIGAQTWGVRTVIDNGRDGLLVPFGDVAALAEAIDRLVSDPELCQQLGDRGHAKVLAEHTWAHKYPVVRTIYSDLVRQKSGAS
jgi:glycosyltransferase involved in cell wall biosynthesis